MERQVTRAAALCLAAFLVAAADVLAEETGLGAEGAFDLHPPPTASAPQGHRHESPERPQPAAGRQVASGPGRPCQEFHQVVVIGGKREELRGIACRQPDGRWRLMAD